MNAKEIVNKIFYSFMGLVSHYVVIVAFLISVIYRFVVHLILLQYYQKKYRLVNTGLATIMAGETKGPVNVLYVLKCRGIPKFDAIVEKLHQIVKYETNVVSGGESGKSYRPFEKLSHVIVPKFGVFCWKLDHIFRAANHVVLDTVHRNLDNEIQERCERLLDTFHGDHQPQWEMHVLIREDSKEYAIVWSVHHTFGDATIFTQLIRYCLADNPFPMKIDPLEWNRKKWRPFQKLAKILEALILCTLGSGCFAAIYGQCLGQTHVKENDLKENRGRHHCRAVTLDLTKFKAIQRQLSKGTPIRLISLLFACTAPAINRALSSSKLKKPTTILASTVEANYPYGSLELVVEVTSLWFDLPLNIKSLQERLRLIDTNIRKVTGRLRMSLFKIGTVLVGTVTSPIAKLLEESGSLTHTTYISNIVGPQESFTIFGGDLVTSIYVYSPISIEEVFTSVAFTYGDEITLALVAPDRVIRKLPDLLDDVIDGLRNEMSEYLEFSKLK